MVSIHGWFVAVVGLLCCFSQTICAARILPVQVDLDNVIGDPSFERHYEDLGISRNNTFWHPFAYGYSPTESSMQRHYGRRGILINTDQRYSPSGIYQAVPASKLPSGKKIELTISFWAKPNYLKNILDKEMTQTNESRITFYLDLYFQGSSKEKSLVMKTVSFDYVYDYKTRSTWHHYCLYFTIDAPSPLQSALLFVINDKVQVASLGMFNFDLNLDTLRSQYAGIYIDDVSLLSRAAAFVMGTRCTDLSYYNGREENPPNFRALKITTSILGNAGSYTITKNYHQHEGEYAPNGVSVLTIVRGTDKLNTLEALIRVWPGPIQAVIQTEGSEETRVREMIKENQDLRKWADVQLIRSLKSAQSGIAPTSLMYNTALEKASTETVMILPEGCTFPPFFASIARKYHKALHARKVFIVPVFRVDIESDFKYPLNKHELYSAYRSGIVSMREGSGIDAKQWFSNTFYETKVEYQAQAMMAVIVQKSALEDADVRFDPIVLDEGDGLAIKTLLADLDLRGFDFFISNEFFVVDWDSRDSLIQRNIAQDWRKWYAFLDFALKGRSLDVSKYYVSPVTAPMGKTLQFFGTLLNMDPVFMKIFAGAVCFAVVAFSSRYLRSLAASASTKEH